MARTKYIDVFISTKSRILNRKWEFKNTKNISKCLLDSHADRKSKFCFQVGSKLIYFLQKYTYILNIFNSLLHQMFSKNCAAINFSKINIFLFFGKISINTYACFAVMLNILNLSSYDALKNGDGTMS